jgi:hypothetical protein
LTLAQVLQLAAQSEQIRPVTNDPGAQRQWPGRSIEKPGLQVRQKVDWLKQLKQLEAQALQIASS